MALLSSVCLAAGALLAILGPLKENHFGPHAPPKGYGFHSIWFINQINEMQ